MIVGKVGDLAYLDSPQGLIPCKVTALSEDRREVTVDFDPEGEALHWSGMTSNAWKGRTGEVFNTSHVVPRRAVRGEKIAAYQWEPT